MNEVVGALHTDVPEEVRALRDAGRPLPPGVSFLPMRPEDAVGSGLRAWRSLYVAGVMEHCAGMGMESGDQAPRHASPDPRCDEHCAGHASAAPDARVPVVPPLILPPASPAELGTVAHAPERASLPDATLLPPDPPPTLRFCSLLI